MNDAYDEENKFDRSILPTENTRKSYTQEENYRAYKLFCMMDVDGGGSISLREINRVLMGETVRYVTVKFDHPDTGILFGLDEEQYVYIADFERESVAAEHPDLVKHMRLHKINNYKLKPKAPKELHKVLQELLRLGDEEVELEFYEPAIIINKFSCYLDIEVDSQVFACQFPVGAYYDAANFEETMMTTMMQTSPILQFIDISLNSKNRQVILSSNQFSFRMLFASGKNYRLSCRYALGFSGEDTPYAKKHVGQPMLMNLHLGLSEEKMEVLMLELFTQFDTDGSGEFEFEEFRDFYIKYLDNEESQQRLREYAHYRFRDIERERFVQAEIEERRSRAKRKSEMRVRNADIIAKQRKDFIENSYVDEKGMRRRKYRHPSSRPGSQSGSRPTSGGAASSQEELLEWPEQSKAEALEKEFTLDDDASANLEGRHSEAHSAAAPEQDFAVVPPPPNDIIKPSQLLLQGDSITDASELDAQPSVLSTVVPPSPGDSQIANDIPAVTHSPTHCKAIVLPPSSPVRNSVKSHKDAYGFEESRDDGELELEHSLQPSMASSVPQKYTNSSTSVSSGSYEALETDRHHHHHHHHHGHHESNADHSKSSAPTDGSVASVEQQIIKAEHVAVPHKDRIKKARIAKRVETKTIPAEEDEEQKLLRKLKREEILKQKRLQQKERLQRQSTKRSQMFRKLLEANKSLLQQQKAAKLIDTSGTTGEGRLTIEMMALYYQVKKAIIASMKLSMHGEYSQFAQYDVDVKKVVASPAVTVLPGILSNMNAAKGFEFSVVSAQKQHPTVLDYFLLKENHSNVKEMCNQEYLHPVFFFSDHIRHPTRNSHHALGMIKFMKHIRDLGVHYRAEHHLPHFKGREAPRPLDEMLPNEKKKFLAGKKSVTFMLEQQEEAANHEGIIARLTIQSIVLENLPSIHVFEKNSPFVTIQCGYQGYLNDSKNTEGKNVLRRVPEYRYAFSTEAFSYAGNYCAWEDLDYIIKLRRTDDFIISAFSGSQQNSIKFGSFVFKATDLAAEKPNQEHVIELVGELIDDEFEKRLEAWTRTKPSHDALSQAKTTITPSIDKTFSSSKNDASRAEEAPTDPSNPNASTNTNANSLSSLLQNTLPVLKSSLKSGGQLLKSTTTKLLSNANQVTSNALETLTKSEHPTTHKPRKMGTFRIRIYIEQGGEWDWFVQSYNQHQRRIHQIKDQIQLYAEIAAKMNRAKAKSIASASQLGGEASGPSDESSVWSNALDSQSSKPVKDSSAQIQYILQIHSVSIFDMLPTNPWFGIFTGKHEWYLLLDTGNVELTTIDQVGVDSDENTGKEWSFLQWELPLSTYYQKRLIFRIYSHRTLIGKYVLPVDYVIQRIDTTIGQQRKGTTKFKPQELEFFGDILNDKQELCGKMLIKSVAFPAPPNISSVVPMNLRSPSQHSISRSPSFIASSADISKQNTNPKRVAMESTASTKSRVLSEVLPWAKNNEHLISAPVITEHNVNLLTDESITLLVNDILVMDITSSAVHTNMMSSLLRNLRTQSLQTVIQYHSEAFTTPAQPPANGGLFPWNVQFTKVNHSFPLLSDRTHNLRFYVKYGDSVIGECALANAALVETHADPTGRREMLAILTAPNSSVTANRLQPFVASSTNTQSNAHGTVTGKLRFSYYLFSTPQPKAPMSAIAPQLTLYQTLCYPLLVTLMDITVFHLRSVHTFHKNSPAIKFTNPIPLQSMQEQDHPAKVVSLTTPSIKHAGSYGKWTNLYWDFVIDREDHIPLYAMQFVVQSEALVVGTGYITFQQLIYNAPDHMGVADVLIPLYCDPKVAKQILLEQSRDKRHTYTSLGEMTDVNIAGELKLSFSLEPHVENNTTDEASLVTSNPEFTGKEYDPANTQFAADEMMLDQGSMDVQNLQLDDLHVVLNRMLRADVLSKFQAPHRVYVQVLCGDYQGNLLLNETPSRYVLQYNNLHANLSIPTNQMLVFRLYTENSQLEEVLLGECMCAIEDIIANGREDKDGFVHYNADIFLEYVPIGAMVMKFLLLPSNDSNTTDLQRLQAADDDATEDFHSLWLQSSTIGLTQEDWNDISQPFWIRVEKVVVTELKEIHSFLRLQRQHRLEHDVKSSYSLNSAELSNPEDASIPPEKIVESDGEELFPFFLQLAYDQPQQKFTIPASSYSFASEDHQAIVFDGMDWVFVVSQPTETWTMSCYHANELLGTVTLQVSDWQYAHPKGPAQQFELLGTMLFALAGDRQKPAGKMSIRFQTKPLFPQVDTSAPTTLNELRKKKKGKKNRGKKRNQTQGDTIEEDKAVGNLFIQSIGISDLFQVYPLFPNSPRVFVTMGKYSFSTTVALDAGKEFIWDDLQWGRLSIHAKDHILIQVLSNHEAIGYCSIGYREMYEHFSPKIDPTTGKKEENKGLLRLELPIMDGSMVKGKLLLLCYGRMHQDALQVLEEEEDDLFSLIDDQSVGSVLSQTRQSQYAVPALSLHTPTPTTTIIDFLGLRIVDFRYDMTTQHLNEKATIMAVVNCGDYSFSTTPKRLVTKKQLQSSFQWLFPRTTVFRWIVRGSPFIKISVYCNTNELVGVVCLNLREWLIQPKDAVGVMSVVRSIVNEENLCMGKCAVSGILAAEFPSEVVATEISFSGSPKSKSNGQGQKKPNRELAYPIEWRVLRIDVMDMINIDWITNVVNARNSTNTLSRFLTNRANSTNKLQYPSMFTPLEAEKITVELRTIDECHSTYLSNDPQAATPGSLPLDILKKFRAISRENLTWKWVFQSEEEPTRDDKHLIEIELFYGVESLIILSISLEELIALPRSYQGYGEYCCYLNPQEKSYGKLKISYFLHTATIPDVLSLTNQAKKVLAQVDELSLQSPIMKIRCHLITCQEISLFFPHCYVYLMIDKVSWTSEKSSNDHGMVLFPLTKIQKDYVLITDRSIVFLRVHDATSHKIVGTVCLSFHDLVAATYDNNLQMTVIQKELTIGLNRMGKLSMTLERYYDLGYIPRKEDIPFIEEPEETDDLSLADLPALSDGSEIIIVGVDVWELVRIASPNIRNSPMVSVEYLGLKFCSDSIPFADSAASWEEFFWKLTCRSSGVLKLRVLSSSMVIGTVNVPMKEVYTMIPDPISREIAIERSIRKGDKINGKIRLRCVCPVAAVKPKVHAMLKRTNSSMVTTNSILSSKNSVVPLRTALQSRVLKQNIELFQTLRVGDPAMRVAGYAKDDQSTIHSQAYTVESNELESKGLDEPSGSLVEDSFHTNSFFSSTTGFEESAVTSSQFEGVKQQDSQVSFDSKGFRPKTSRGPSIISSQPSENLVAGSSVLSVTPSTQGPELKGSSSSVNKFSKYSSYLASIAESTSAYTYKYSKQSPGKRLPPTPPVEEEQQQDSVPSSRSHTPSYFTNEPTEESHRYTSNSGSFYTAQSESEYEGSNSWGGSMSSRSDYSTDDGSTFSESNSSYSTYSTSAYSSDFLSRASEGRPMNDTEEPSTAGNTYSRSEEGFDRSDYETAATENNRDHSRSVAFAMDEIIPVEAHRVSSRSYEHMKGDENAEFLQPANQLPSHYKQSNLVFDIQQLTFLDTNTMDVKHTILHTATAFVSKLLTRVIESLVAEQASLDYDALLPSSNSQQIAAVVVPSSFTHDLIANKNWKISYLMSLETVQVILRTGGTAALHKLTTIPNQPVVAFSDPTKSSSKGPQFAKRQGIMMLSASQPVDTVVDPDITNTNEKPKPYIMEKLVKRGKTEFYIPLKARITIQDILGIDVSLIDRRVMPTRPYLTACKPYGNWAAETNPMIIDLSLPDAHQQAYLLNYFNLHVRYKWDSFTLKQGQVLVFDLHDARSGLLFGKCTLPYEDCFNPHTLANVVDKEVDYLTQLFEAIVPLVFTVADEYGGGQLAGIMRLTLDLSINIFTPSQKPTSYWDTHRMEHWCTYPLPPISYGMIRQKYRDIAYDYDNQQLIHPSLFGFTLRFRGNQQDESRFKHPIFTNYSLVKRILPLSTKGAMKRKSTTSKSSSGPGKSTPAVNPYRYDPNAKERGQCPVCSDGLPGCPRCFMMPVRPSDNNPFTPAEFGFSAGDDRQQKLRLEKKLLELHMQKTKQLASLERHKEALKEYSASALAKVSAKRGRIIGDNNEEDDDDEEMESAVDVMSSLSELHKDDMILQLKQQIEEQYEIDRAALLKAAENDELDDDADSPEAQRRRERKAVNFHTNLTSYRSIRDHRLLASSPFNVYVKFLPTGYVKRFTANPTFTIAHLYHMFQAHSSYGNNVAPMILLPTNVGVFELHPYLSFASDVMRADNRGHDTLSAYHLTEPFASYVLLFVANYPQVKSTTTKSYVNNPDKQIPMMLSDFFSKNTDYPLPVLPTYHGIDKLPAATKENPTNHLISQDKVQQYLVRIISYAYMQQQKESLQFYKQLGRQYQESLYLSKQIKQNAEVARLNYLAKQQQQLELRNESQLRKFGSNKKKMERARQKLATREQSKRRILRVDEVNDLEAREGEGEEETEWEESSAQRSADEISLSEVMFLEDANEERDVLKEITIELASSTTGGEGEGDVDSVMTEDDDWWEASSSKGSELDDGELDEQTSQQELRQPSDEVSAPVMTTGSTLQTIAALRQHRSSASASSTEASFHSISSPQDTNEDRSSVDATPRSFLSAMTSSTFSSQQTGETSYASLSSTSQLASSLPPSVSTAYSSYFTAVSTSYDQEERSQHTIATSRSFPISYPSDVRQPIVSTDDALSLYSRHKLHDEDSSAGEGSGVYSHTHSLYSVVSSQASLTTPTTASSASAASSVSGSLRSHELSHSTGGLFTYRSQQSLDSLGSRSLETLPSMASLSLMSPSTASSTARSLYSDQHSQSSSSAYDSAYDSASASAAASASTSVYTSSQGSASASRSRYGSKQTSSYSSSTTVNKGGKIVAAAVGGRGGDEEVGSLASLLREDDDVSQLTLPEEINSALGYSNLPDRQMDEGTASIVSLQSEGSERGGRRHDTDGSNATATSYSSYGSYSTYSGDGKDSNYSSDKSQYSSDRSYGGSTTTGNTASKASASGLATTSYSHSSTPYSPYSSQPYSENSFSSTTPSHTTHTNTTPSHTTLSNTTPSYTTQSNTTASYTTQSNTTPSYTSDSYTTASQASATDSISRNSSIGRSHTSSSTTTGTTFGPNTNRSQLSSGYSADYSNNRAGESLGQHLSNERHSKSYVGYGYIDDTTASTNLSTPSTATSLGSHGNSSWGMTRPHWLSEEPQYPHHTIDTISEREEEYSSSTISSFRSRSKKAANSMSRESASLQAHNSVGSLSAITDIFDQDSQSSYRRQESDNEKDSYSRDSAKFRK